jgi:isopenicillin N synthase-like dioxygenase
MSIATLDFNHYQSGTAIEQANFRKDFVQALSSFGFVKLRNHGIPKDVIKGLFIWVSRRAEKEHLTNKWKMKLTPDTLQNQRFFNLPLEVKMKVAHPKQANPHRGYSYVGQEKLSRVAGFEKGRISDQDILDIKV